MIEKFNTAEDKDYERSVGYCDSILNNCPASVFHIVLKCENLLRAYKLKEAQVFSKDLMKRPDTCTVPIIIAWCGRIRAYSGGDIIGMKLIKDALQRDPDLKDAMKALKLIKTVGPLKDEANALVKEEKYEEAIAKFDECLLLDPLNITYNASILLNKSIAQTKLG